MRSPITTVALIALTIVLGLGFRFAHLGLPPFAVKYGGSVMWAAMVYWIVSAVVRGIGRAAVISCVIAAAVEFFKLVHTPGLDAFRRTLAGVILLGRFFSVYDLVAYGVAILVASWVDVRLRGVKVAA